MLFGPLSLARFRPERGQQPKTIKTTKGLFFFFPVLLLFFIVFPYLCVSRFSCYSSFISLICFLFFFFFRYLSFFTHLVLLLFLLFLRTAKQQKKEKRDNEWKKTKRKQHEKQQTRRIGANRRWREINKHKPPPPIHRKVESTKKIKRGVDAEVQMRHSCVKGGGGNVSWGRLALVFPGFARFPHVVDFG